MHAEHFPRLKPACPSPPSFPTIPRHVVAIIGGAVAGSEAAAMCAERGLLALVIEQNERPFGKIEDGLPRWHQKLRDKEYAQIGSNLDRAGVLFLPRTQLGRDVTLDQLIQEWGVNAVLLASGAWRDRAPFEAASSYDGKGLTYQNPFVYWYNHYPDMGYDGPRFEVHDDALVMGGGLASIDVVKIINCELFKRALAERRIQVTTEELEHAGIREVLAQHGLSQAELGIKGADALLPPRKDRDAPRLAAGQRHPPAARKSGASARQGHGQGDRQVPGAFCGQPSAPWRPSSKPAAWWASRFSARTPSWSRGSQAREPPGRLGRGTLAAHRQLHRLDPGADSRRAHEGRAGRLFEPETGRVRGFEHVFGLGNVLTGKGNIKESRKSSAGISSQVLSYLGLGGELSLAPAHSAARAAAEPRFATRHPNLRSLPDRITKILAHVRQQWARVGYEGDYASWISRVTPGGRER